MITSFKLFESNIQVNINLPDDIFNNLVNTLTFTVYKGKKRDEKRSRNYKVIRIKNLDGYYNQNRLNHKESSNECLLQIQMTNKDKIEAKFTRVIDLEQVKENSVYIEINGEPKYHLDNENYDINSFIGMIGTHYQKYIEGKNWKVR